METQLSSEAALYFPCRSASHLLVARELRGSGREAEEPGLSKETNSWALWARRRRPKVLLSHSPQMETLRLSVGQAPAPAPYGYLPGLEQCGLSKEPSWLARVPWDPSLTKVFPYLSLLMATPPLSEDRATAITLVPLGSGPEAVESGPSRARS